MRSGVFWRPMPPRPEVERQRAKLDQEMATAAPTLQMKQLDQRCRVT